MGDFAFRIRRIDNIFEAESWRRLDKSFHLSKTIHFDKGPNGLKGDPNVETELAFRPLVGGRADIEAFIKKAEGKYYFGLSFLYGSNFLNRACGQGLYFYNPLIWENERVGETSAAAGVAAILTGDDDKDGKTDLLVVLSTGAAYVFRQVPGRLPPTTCESHLEARRLVLENPGAEFLRKGLRPIFSSTSEMVTRFPVKGLIKVWLSS